MTGRCDRQGNARGSQMPVRHVGVCGRDPLPWWSCMPRTDSPYHRCPCRVRLDEAATGAAATARRSAVNHRLHLSSGTDRAFMRRQPGRQPPHGEARSLVGIACHWGQVAQRPRRQPGRQQPVGADPSRLSLGTGRASSEAATGAAITGLRGLVSPVVGDRSRISRGGNRGGNRGARTHEHPSVSSVARDRSHIL
jgi:hypothetical protein